MLQMPKRSTALTAVLVLTAGLILTACGGKAAPDAAPEPEVTEDGTQLAALWPLTGLPVDGAKTPKHPVLMVKIDNTRSSQPQVGLSHADMVVEELVEGGITRLAAMFYSDVPDVVGPVRSARATDIGIIKATNAVLIASGAAPPTYARLNRAGVKYFSEDGPGYYRESSRYAPYNLFVSLPKLVDSLSSKPVVPAPYLPWGSEEDFSGVQAATTVRVRFSPATTTTFAYDAKNGVYDNVNTHAGADDQYRPDTVLVLRVRVGDAGYLDPGGNRVPETLFFGQGNMMMFHKGQMLRGTWSKPTRESPLELSTQAGDITVPPGHVWIELLPNAKAGGDITFEP